MAGIEERLLNLGRKAVKPVEVKVLPSLHGQEFCDWVHRWEADVHQVDGSQLLAISVPFHCEGEERQTEMWVCFQSLKPVVQAHCVCTKYVEVKVLDCPVPVRMSDWVMEHIGMDWESSPVRDMR